MMSKGETWGRRGGAAFRTGDWPAPVRRWYRPGRFTLGLGVAAVMAAVVVNHGRWREDAARLGLVSMREVGVADVSYGPGGLLVSKDRRPLTGVVQEHYPSGALRSRKQVVDGRLEGVSEVWYPGGGLQVREYYEAGRPHGPQRTWYPSGRLMSETPMVRGVPQGVERRWSEDGTLVTERRLESREWAANRVAR